ncbi:MAG: hypothetical protein BGN89_16920 [Alphaproteobacteria bacterium 64-6]|nr:MAG: hypothetical protein BGN89_16920 [Alphaproteobacteria bacterium 64-6]
MEDFQMAEFPKLLNLLYDAAIDPTRWQTFLNVLSSTFSNANGILYEFDRETGHTQFSFGFGNDPAFIAPYLDHFQHINPYRDASGCAPLGVACRSSLVLDVESVSKSEFYNDWMRPQGIPADHLGLLLERRPTTHITFGLAPNAKALAKHNKKYIQWLNLLAPHITRALEINRITREATRERSNAERVAGVVLNIIDAAAFIVTPGGRPVQMNSRAEALLKSRSLLGVEGGGRLVALHPSGDAALSAAVMQLTTKHVSSLQDACGPIPLRSMLDGSTFYAWLIAILPETAAAARFDIGPSVARPMLVLMVQPANEPLNLNPKVIAAVFKLTSAEAKLVSALAAGYSIGDFAEHAGLSRSTVRNQLAAAFAKTETSRQAELVALVIRRLQWHRIVGELR